MLRSDLSLNLKIRSLDDKVDGIFEPTFSKGVVGSTRAHGR